MKKIIVLLLAVTMVLTFASCGSKTITTVPTDSIVKVSEMTDTDSGINKMAKLLYDESDIDDQGVILAADTIGADKGYRFTSTYNDSHIVMEFYQFNLDSLSDTAKSTINSVKELGSFNMMGISDVKAELTDNGKYLVVYQDSKVTSDKPDDKNVEHKSDVMSIINSVN